MLLIGMPEAIIPLISTGIGVYIGVRGNSLYKKHLEKNGYNAFLIINADNNESAKRQFSDYMTA
jgi:hypothetical protein